MAAGSAAVLRSTPSRHQRQSAKVSDAPRPTILLSLAALAESSKASNHKSRGDRRPPLHRCRSSKKAQASKSECPLIWEKIPNESMFAGRPVGLFTGQPRGGRLVQVLWPKPPIRRCIEPSAANVLHWTHQRTTSRPCSRPDRSGREAWKHRGARLLEAVGRCGRRKDVKAQRESGIPCCSEKSETDSRLHLGHGRFGFFQRFFAAFQKSSSSKMVVNTAAVSIYRHILPELKSLDSLPPRIMNLVRPSRRVTCRCISQKAQLALPNGICPWSF